MVFLRLKNAWEQLRNFGCRNLFQTQNSDDVTSLNDARGGFRDAMVQAYTNKACKYADLGKPFDGVLFTGQKTSAIIVKRLENFNCALTLGDFFGDSKMFERNDIFEHNNFGQEIKNDTTMKIAGMIIPFFMMNKSISQIEVNVKPNKMVSIGAGFEIKDNVNKNTDHIFQSCLNVKHPSVVLDAKIELPMNQASHKDLKMKFSNVFYHRFKNVDVAIGLDWMKDFAYYSSRRIFHHQGLSISIVRPGRTIYRFTLNPRERACTVNGYWQLKNSLSVASSLKLNWADYRNFHSLNHSIWRFNEVGLNYRHSKHVSFGIKSNLIGDVSMGAWLNVYSNVTAVAA